MLILTNLEYLLCPIFYQKKKQNLCTPHDRYAHFTDELGEG